jgi:hypothetical protein
MAQVLGSNHSTVQHRDFHVKNRFNVNCDLRLAGEAFPGLKHFFAMFGSFL